MKKQANSILQDILLDTYWANTVGKSRYPGAYQNYLDELERNMLKLLKKKVTYYMLQEILSDYGYDKVDIDKTFKKLTGVDPQKMLFVRFETLRNTSSIVPTYNYGWGESKKKDGYYYIMKNEYPNSIGEFIIYFVSDKNPIPQEVEACVSHEESLKKMKSKVKKVFRYDIPAWEEALQYKDELVFDETEDYKELDEMLYKNNISGKRAAKIIEDNIKNGKISYDMGLNLFRVYAAEDDDKKISKDHEPESEIKDKEKEEIKEDFKKETKESQEISLSKELEKKTPVDFFKSNLPNRLDISIPDQIQSVLVYINNKASDISKFEIKLFKMNYELKEKVTKMITTGESENMLEYVATVNIILEFKDKSTGKSKFGLIVFFISPDGIVTTSDSFKGEDDIVYGFTEVGLEQYFGKNA